MSAQTRYGYSMPIGTAGGIVDTAPYSIVSRINEEETGSMKFGIGVVQGSKPGTNVTAPTEDSTAAEFEGITVNNHHTEHDLEGDLHIRKGAAIGTMTYGRVYARVATGVTPAYGDGVYVIIDGDEVGYLTNKEVKKTEGEGENATTTVCTIAIKGRFLGGVDSTTKVAPVELFNQAQA